MKKLRRWNAHSMQLHLRNGYRRAQRHLKVFRKNPPFYQFFMQFMGLLYHPCSNYTVYYGRIDGLIWLAFTRYHPFQYLYCRT
ncbi:uncharacterized protein J3R85_011126, partial [Psidium guajava]